MPAPVGCADDEPMLLTEFRGRADSSVDAEPDRVFATLTDIAHLPQWNRRIAKVLRVSPGPLEPGFQWCVQMVVPPARWVSRARLVRYEPDQRVFAHISQTDDGNPSFAEWTWTVTPAGDGSRIHVEWAVHPKTFWRRLLLARLRERQLPREVDASMSALSEHLAQRSASV